MFHFLNKVCEKKGKSFFFLSHCVLPSLIQLKIHVIHIFIDDPSNFLNVNRHWIPGSRVQTRPGSMDSFFQSIKILSMTFIGREVKLGSRVVELRHVKEPQAEISTSEQICRTFHSHFRKRR